MMGSCITLNRFNKISQGMQSFESRKNKQNKFFPPVLVSILLKGSETYNLFPAVGIRDNGLLKELHKEGARKTQ